MKKSIYIHVGPPKTGTSAAQKWFNDNADFLKSLSIYYPTHESDSNGISSGNLLSLYLKKEDGSIELSSTKATFLVEEFNKSDSEILLLSSEFFFQRMPEIKLCLPSAIFIGYLRDPMEKRESSYNQGVKRHSFTHPFPNTLQKTITDLLQMEKIIDQYGTNSFNVRVYGEKYFHHGNIVSDILFAMGIDQKLQIQVINNSYHFEALEFKRWINHYPTGQYSHKLDRALQKYTKGTKKYSLLKSEQYKLQKKSDLRALTEFIKNKKIDNKKVFMDDLHEKKPPLYKYQKITNEEFSDICEYLLKEINDEFKSVGRIVANHNQGIKSDFTRILTSKTSIKRNPLLSIKNYWSTKLRPKGNSFTSKHSIQGLDELKTKINNETTNAELLIELAIFAETNNNYGFATLLMEEALKHRPKGKYIKKKLSEYKKKE